MKRVRLEAIVPDDVEIKDLEDVLLNAISLEVIGVIEEEAGVLRLKPGKVYKYEEVWSSGVEYLEFPDGRRFRVSDTIPPTAPEDAVGFEVVEMRINTPQGLKAIWILKAVMKPGWKPHRKKVS